MKSALASIEQIYNLALNPEIDYYAQLEPLAANGELANHNSSMQVLFKLAMIIDEQAKQIKALEQKNVDKSQGENNTQVSLKPVQPIVSDPTQPLSPVVPPDEPITPTAGSDADAHIQS